MLFECDQWDEVKGKTLLNPRLRAIRLPFSLKVVLYEDIIVDFAHYVGACL